ncbi:MAG: 3-dehydroquinate synthase [Desulfurivibrionaceae bacterium]
MKQIDVELKNREYPILINKGIIESTGKDLARRRIASRYIIIADNQVAPLYGKRLLDSLKEAGVKGDILTFPSGEASKNLATIGDLTSRLAQSGADRKTCLIAMGGGVTGDITGFTASIYMRGIPFIQVPTSLLAQVDSSVGGKTGVDIPEGKNLVGTFNQPRLVYIDPDFLKTLPSQELMNGLAEIIKYSIIYDSDLFGFLQENRSRILSLDPEVMAEVIARCCRIKAEVVAADEKESDLRRILNYGHTLGHAIEAASGYLLSHGMAVALGMIAINRIAVLKSLLNKKEAEEIKGLVEAFGLPVKLPPDFTPSTPEIKSYLKTDKKAVAGRPVFILPRSIGRITISDEVEEWMIDEALTELATP